MPQLHEIEATLTSVFTPSAPVSDVRLLRGRASVRTDISHAIGRSGAHIVLYGERGVGKSSVAKIEAQFAQGSPYYYSVGAQDTFDTITTAVLQYYGVGWVPESREAGTESRVGTQFGAPGAKGEFSFGANQSSQDRQIGNLTLTPQQVANRLADVDTLVVVDDFERLQGETDREAFADLVKKLSDNESPATFMFVGIGETVDGLLAAHESAERCLVEIRVDRLSSDEIGEVVTTGMQVLGIEFESDIHGQIVSFSAGFPHYTHLLCEGAVRAFIEREAQEHSGRHMLTQADLNSSITYAIRNAQRSISQAYENAVRSIQGSSRFKYCLYAIASWPEEPVAYGDICRWVGGLEGAPAGTVNVSHQLKRLVSLGIVEKVSMGHYRLRNPLLKAYVILKARADTPEAELAAIDAQLNQVTARLRRFRER